MPIFTTRFFLFLVVAAALVSLGAHVVHANHHHPIFSDRAAEACHFSDRKIMLPLTDAVIASALSFNKCNISPEGTPLPARTGEESFCLDPFRIALREGILHPKLGG